MNKTNVRSAHSDDIIEINNTLLKEFSLPGIGDFKSFARFHAYNSGFSIFSCFPSYKGAKTMKPCRRRDTGLAR